MIDLFAGWLFRRGLSLAAMGLFIMSKRNPEKLRVAPMAVRNPNVVVWYANLVMALRICVRRMASQALEKGLRNAQWAFDVDARMADRRWTPPREGDDDAQCDQEATQDHAGCVKEPRLQEEGWYPQEGGMPVLSERPGGEESAALNMPAGKAQMDPAVAASLEKDRRGEP